MTLFLANVPWAPLGAPLVPQSVLKDKNASKVTPNCKQKLKITSRSDAEGP